AGDPALPFSHAVHSFDAAPSCTDKVVAASAASTIYCIAFRRFPSTSHGKIHKKQQNDKKAYMFSVLFAVSIILLLEFPPFQVISAAFSISRIPPATPVLQKK